MEFQKVRAGGHRNALLLQACHVNAQQTELDRVSERPRPLNQLPARPPDHTALISRKEIPTFNFKSWKVYNSRKEKSPGVPLTR